MENYQSKDVFKLLVEDKEKPWLVHPVDKYPLHVLFYGEHVFFNAIDFLELLQLSVDTHNFPDILQSPPIQTYPKMVNRDVYSLEDIKFHFDHHDNAMMYNVTNKSPEDNNAEDLPDPDRPTASRYDDSSFGYFWPLSSNLLKTPYGPFHKNELFLTFGGITRILTRIAKPIPDLFIHLFKTTQVPLSRELTFYENRMAELLSTCLDIGPLKADLENNNWFLPLVAMDADIVFDIESHPYNAYVSQLDLHKRAMALSEMGFTVLTLPFNASALDLYHLLTTAGHIFTSKTSN